MGGSVLAELSALSGSCAALGLLPTAGTEPTCFDGAADCDDFGGDAECRDFRGSPIEDGDDAGWAVDSGRGGFVLAELISLAGIDAASGLLPSAGTEPTCFDVGTGRLSVEAEPRFKANVELRTEEMSFVRV